MLSNGVDPLLLRYSIKRASRDAFHEDLAELRELVGNRVDVDAIINPQLDVDELNRLLLPYQRELADPKLNIMVPLRDNPDADTIDRLLKWSYKYKRMEVFQFLLANVANRQMWVDDVLASASEVELIRSLLAYGADIHREDDFALRWGLASQIEAVKIYLAHEANVRAGNDEALQRASYNGNCELIRLLLAYGANVHARKDTALRQSSQQGNVEVVKELLAHGASPRAEMVQQARIAGQNEIADLLQAKLGYLSKIALFLISRLFPANTDSAVDFRAVK
jgi:hypothetical protein